MCSPARAVCLLPTTHTCSHAHTYRSARVSHHHTARGNVILVLDCLSFHSYRIHDWLAHVLRYTILVLLATCVLSMCELNARSDISVYECSPSGISVFFFVVWVVEEDSAKASTEHRVQHNRQHAHNIDVTRRRTRLWFPFDGKIERVRERASQSHIINCYCWNLVQLLKLSVLFHLMNIRDVDKPQNCGRKAANSVCACVI